MAGSKMTFQVASKRIDDHSSLSNCKNAQISMDTDLSGNPEAFNPAELLLAALSACMIKSIERVGPILKFSLRSVEVRIDGVRQDVPVRVVSDAASAVRRLCYAQFNQLLDLSAQHAVHRYFVRQTDSFHAEPTRK